MSAITPLPPKRDLLISARIPRRLRERVVRAGQAYAEAQGLRRAPSFNACVNAALEEFADTHTEAAP